MRLIGAVLTSTLTLTVVSGCVVQGHVRPAVTDGVVAIDLAVDSLVLTTVQGETSALPLGDAAALLRALTRELGLPRVSTPDPACPADQLSYNFGEALRVTRSPSGSETPARATVRFFERSVDDPSGHPVDLRGPGGLQVGDSTDNRHGVLLEKVRPGARQGVVAASDHGVVAWLGAPIEVGSAVGC
jgi:hypothetical protein